MKTLTVHLHVIDGSIDEVISDLKQLQIRSLDQTLHSGLYNSIDKLQEVLHNIHEMKLLNIQEINQMPEIKTSWVRMVRTYEIDATTKLYDILLESELLRIEGTTVRNVLLSDLTVSEIVELHHAVPTLTFFLPFGDFGS